MGIIIEQLAVPLFAFLQTPLGLSALGNIASHLRGSHDSAMRVPHRRDGQRKLDQASVFAHAYSFEMVHPLTVTNPIEDGIFLTATIRWNDQADWLPNCLRGGVSEHPFRTLIPACNSAIEILADDGVVRRFHYCSQAAGGGFGLLLRRAVTSHWQLNCLPI